MKNNKNYFIIKDEKGSYLPLAFNPPTTSIKREFDPIELLPRAPQNIIRLNKKDRSNIVPENLGSEAMIQYGSKPIVVNIYNNQQNHIQYGLKPMQQPIPNTAYKNQYGDEQFPLRLGEPLKDYRQTYLSKTNLQGVKGIEADQSLNERREFTDADFHSSELARRASAIAMHTGYLSKRRNPSAFSRSQN